MLTKSKLLLNLQCPRYLWLNTYNPELAKVGSDSNSRMAVGDEVGILARSMALGGELVASKNSNEAIEQTQLLLIQNQTRPIFEAAFSVSDLLVRIDLLFPRDDGYKLVEVKSSTSIKPYHLQDAAIQTWVLRAAQKKPVNTFLSLINPKFNYKGNSEYAGLFEESDISNEINDLVNLVPIWNESAKETVALNKEPIHIKTGTQCNKPFPCPYFEYCISLEERPEFPIEILPYGSKIVQKLKKDGFRDLKDVPDGLLENEIHIRIHRVSKSGMVELAPEAKEILDPLPYPRFYLDFETISSAIPRIPNTHPYSQVPFQWSCHIEGEDKEIVHAEFLDVESTDPRRSFSESLIKLLGERGTIFTYSGFEESRINDLISIFPDLKTSLTSIKERIFDLLVLSRAHYYHPDMKGSWSIKKVLPTITNLSYEHLTVQNGGMAQEAYRELVADKLDPIQNRQLKDSLLNYCRQDTLALVELVMKFSQK